MLKALLEQSLSFHEIATSHVGKCGIEVVREITTKGVDILRKQEELEAMVQVQVLAFGGEKRMSSIITEGKRWVQKEIDGLSRVLPLVCCYF